MDRSDAVSAFSLPRLATYERLADGDWDQAVALYAWNAELAAAFYLPLHTWEVALRNTCHTAMTGWLEDEWWWTSPRRTAAGQPFVTTSVTSAFGRYENWARAERHSDRSDVPVSADDVVASSTLGTWCDLLAKANNLAWTQALRYHWPKRTAQRDGA